ncbi:HPF/RaiA family ribosome-associated protein [Maribacter polysiphoniae]|uniref:HPF/RaiA family ribosome-associated protein n=1 Tax=Maribacter polysiphoniae TaxID=429344 RepID=UPI0023543C4B|nr:HPF/RaiA family ribosome-associated protein [Maribacter polysiphoniae]
MKIIYEYDNITASNRLETIVEKELNNLLVKYQFVIRGDVFFKKENFQGDKDKGCGIRLSVPGPRIYASSTEDSFEAAIKKSIRELENQLEGRKDKMSTY